MENCVQSKYSWTKKEVIELIDMLHATPALWDVGIKEYRDRNLKFEEMSKMAKHFTTNVDEISRKIKSLKTQFCRERKKIEEKSESGTGMIPEENIWFGYRMMKFLMEKNVSLGSCSTIKVLLAYPVNHVKLPHFVTSTILMLRCQFLHHYQYVVSIVLIVHYV